jgi:hypothetical protein
MATILLSKGTVIQMASASAGTYTAIPNPISIEGPGLEVPTLDKTTLSDTRRRKRPGLPDPGEATLKIFHDPLDAQHAAIKTACETNLIKYFKIIVQDAGVTYATALITAYPTGLSESGLEIDGQKVADVKLSLDDFVTWS